MGTKAFQSTLDLMSDEEIATRVRMLMRSDLDHEPVVCAARDRILLLSKQKKDLLDACKALMNFPGVREQAASGPTAYAVFHAATTAIINAEND